MAKKKDEKEIKEKRDIGRPDETLVVLELAKKYLMGGWKDVGDVIPSISGLACYCGKHRDSIYEYGKKSTDFSDILKSILTLQENKLLNGGLSSSFNATITKLILTKHGYSDRPDPIKEDGEDDVGKVTVTISSAKKSRD